MVEGRYVISAACSGVVQALLSRYRKAVPSVNVTLQELESPLQVQLLEEGKLDACIVRTVAGDQERVERISLGSEATVIAVAKDHPILSSTTITLKDLAKESFIVPQFAREPGFAKHLAKIGEHAGFTPQIGHQTRDFITVLTLVGAGFGIAAVPASVASLSLPGITYLSLGEVLERSELSIIFRRHERSPAIKRLRELAVTTLDCLP
jgi:DNA-binding transcriptional LysR family regulator